MLFPNIKLNSPSPYLEIDLLFLIISSNVSCGEKIFKSFNIKVTLHFLQFEFFFLFFF